MREAFTSTLRGSDPSSFPIAKTDVQRLELMRALSARGASLCVGCRPFFRSHISRRTGASVGAPLGYLQEEACTLLIAGEGRPRNKQGITFLRLT